MPRFSGDLGYKGKRKADKDPRELENKGNPVLLGF